MKKWISFCLLLLAVSSATAASKIPFEFHDGDRVVFLGDTLIEREQLNGYVELALATHSPKTKVTFRNLGWSGDTPEGASRFGLSLLQAGHEPADEGWKQLLNQLELTKPTVVFLGYGMANSFDGEKGLAKFNADLNKLIDSILAKNPSTRFVFLSPIRHENLGAPLPNPAAHNQNLKLYSDAISKVAAQRGFPFVSLFDLLNTNTRLPAENPQTDNGIHLNANGYKQAALAIEEGLGWKSSGWRTNPNAEALRQLILRKNQLFFNRSRPQNVAYILGFRKYEQGKNAAEIPMFDPLIEESDREIQIFLATRWLSKSPKIPISTVQEAPETIRESAPQPLPNFEVAPGFEVNLFAESPSLAKPIQMNFDPQGRLWIASSSVYPQIEPGQKADDKILVLEDTNGDGKADKSTVFANGLLIPTAVVPGDGGVYVGQSTELLHFKDTDGDGKADQRRVVLSGFGTEDTHHDIHTLRWGPDGQLYFNQSIYIRTDAETPHGVVRLKSGGIFHLRPTTMQMDIFLRGFCNPWGHAFDAFGQSFVTDGAGNQGINFGVRDATYFTYANMRRELKSISPGTYPKFCSLEVIRSEQFPDDWQNNFVTCDFRAHRVVRFGIEEQGAGYVTKEMPDLLRTTDVTFRPIDVKLGPDGALYIADWANPIIQHGEVDFRDPRRDHEHGRIWRVTAKNRSVLKAPNLVGAKNEELFNQLLSPSDFNRTQAQRVLTERGEKIKGDLARWTAKQKDERALLEALWMFQAIDVRNSELLKKVLAANDGRIRAAAVRVLSFWQERDPALQKNLEQAVQDTHPRVRLEAVRALAKIKTAHSAELILSALDFPMDNFLDYAIWLSINDLAPQWISAVKSGNWKPEGREKQLEFALKAIEPKLAGEVLEQVLATRSIPRDGSGPWMDLIGQSGTPALLRKLYDQALADGLDAPAKARAFDVLNEAARLRGAKPSGDLNSISKFFAGEDNVKASAIRLAGTWKIENAVPELFAIALAENTPNDLQKTAFDSLREIGGKKVVDELDNVFSKSTQVSANTKRMALLTFASLNFDKALPHVIQILAETKNPDEAAALWRSFLNIKNAGQKIASQLAKTELPEISAKAGLKVAREGGRNEPALVQALSKTDSSDPEKLFTPEYMKQLAASVAKANPVRGEKIYRRTEMACTSCHAIGGAGGKVGPDLTSIGASAPVDYLIESLLFPNRKIKEGFHSIQVQTKDEQEFSGILVRETEQEIVLRDATGKEISLAKNNVENRRNGASLMPSGLVDSLGDKERADLVRFLSELGKPGPFDASKGNVARAWKMFVLTVDEDQFGTERLVSGDSSVAGWTPFFTMVNGRISKADLEQELKPKASRNPLALYALAKLQLANASGVSLKFGNASPAEIWIDGKKIAFNSITPLQQGKHVVVVKFDPKNLPAEIRMESSEGTFLVE